jgi:hypothetical protein
LNSVSINPFEAVEYELDQVKFKLDDKEIKGRHFHVRFVVGETQFKHYIGKGDSLGEHKGATLLGVHVIHKVGDKPFHWDDKAVEHCISVDECGDKATFLKQVDFNSEHDIIEVAFETPESFGLTAKDEIKELKGGVIYWAGYHVNTSGGFVRLALSKTVDQNGNVLFYDGIHVIPESIIRSKKSLIPQ